MYLAIGINILGIGTIMIIMKRLKNSKITFYILQVTIKSMSLTVIGFHLMPVQCHYDG